MSNSLGIYFGAKEISAAETKGTKSVNNIRIPHSAISGEISEEKVPEELKIVTALKDEFAKKNIEANEVTITLGGKDLIIRTFELAALPYTEISNAINFEAKKYIPFKIEDLVCDFKWKFERSLKKNHVLFVGIRKETLDKYISIANQLGLKINSVEYSAFSILRLFKAARVKEAGIRAVINIDLADADEANFLIMENKFVLFSRDIAFAGAGEESAADKLKREIRISLDYYHRKFPTKNIQRITVISTKDCRPELETFIKELGLAVEFIEINKYIEGIADSSLAFVKSYSSSLSKTIKSSVEINLMLARSRKMTPLKEKINIKTQILALYENLYTGFKLDLRIAVLGLFICILIFTFGLFKISSAQKEIKKTVSLRPEASGINPGTGNNELADIEAGYKAKVKTINGLAKERIYLTELLDALPRLLPEGMWLTNLSFGSAKQQVDLWMDGWVYLGNNNKEMELVNNFRSQLKEDPVFVKYFKNINIVSLDIMQLKDLTMTKFVITCR